MPISEFIFIGLLGVAGILGFRKGLISQVTMFLGLCLGIWLALRFAGLVGEQLAPYGVPAGEKGYLISFVLVFAGVVLGVYFLGRFAAYLERPPCGIGACGGDRQALFPEGARGALLSHTL